MKNFLTALLLSLTVLVTGCSVNEAETATNDQSLSTGLISSSQSSSSSTHNTSQTSNQSSATGSASSSSGSSVTVSENIPEQSSKETHSTSEIIQNTNSTPIHSETVTQSTASASSTSSVMQSSQSTPESTPPEIISQPESTVENKMKTLVVYFSCTNTTKTLAKYAADILGADIYEIVPTEPYTEADLAYYTNGRADQEQNDPLVRPAILGGVDNMSDYDTIILGYPIWHGQAPRIISTFLESYDFSGKTIVPFCTSHSSGIGSSADNLHALCSAEWKSGKRFGGGTSRNEISKWLNEIGLSDR